MHLTVVLAVVGLGVLDLDANCVLVGAHDLFHMTQEVGARAVNDVARRAVDLVDGTAASSVVGPLFEALRESSNELDFGAWAQCQWAATSMKWC